MSYFESLNELYATKIAGRSILNENMPIEVGGFSPEEAKEGLKSHAQRPAADPATKTAVLKRFYLYYIGAIKEISDDVSVVIAINALNNVLLALKTYPGGRYPGPTKEFESEVVGPAVSDALAKGGIKTGKTNIGYISRALVDAATDTGVLKETGFTKRPAASGKTGGAKYSTDDVAKMFGSKSDTPKPDEGDDIGSLA